MYCTSAPMVNATTTERRIPRIISVAFSVLMYWPISATDIVSSADILSKATHTAAPKSSKTIETVVEVGIPSVLKKSSNKISVIMTAIKMIMISSK